MKQSLENIPNYKLNFPILRVNNYGLEKTNLHKKIWLLLKVYWENTEVESVENFIRKYFSILQKTVI